VRLLPALLVAILCAAPAALAEDTLTSFETPHQGKDAQWTFLVEGREAYNASAVVFLNAVRSPFEIMVRAQNGTTMFDQKGARGIQTLPPLAPGRYTVVVKGDGTFSITQRYLDAAGTAGGVTDVNATLGATQGWVIVPSQAWRVFVNGSVSVDWDDLVTAGGSANLERLEAPLNHTILAGRPAFLLLRGDPGSAYSIHLEPAPDLAAAASAPPAAKTPGPTLALVACATLLALALRRGLGRRP